MIIIDNFVKDQQLLDDMIADPTFMQDGACWWNGWWNSDVASTSTRLRLIEYIWRYNTPTEYCDLSICGFEHWSGKYPQDSKTKQDASNIVGIQGHPIFSLIHHFDKDEFLWSTTGQVNTPLVGTVYYPIPHQCTGGHLRIYDTHDCQFDAPYDRITPKYNRLIIFDAAQLHAVEEVTSGTRHGLAINLWQHPLSDGYMKGMREIV